MRWQTSVSTLGTAVGVAHLHESAEHVNGRVYDSVVLGLESVDHLHTNKLTHAGEGRGGEGRDEEGVVPTLHSGLKVSTTHLGSEVKA